MFQLPEEEESLLSLLYQVSCVHGPGQVRCDVDAQELDIVDTLNCFPVDEERSVLCPSGPPVVHYDIKPTMVVVAVPVSWRTNWRKKSLSKPRNASSTFTPPHSYVTSITGGQVRTDPEKIQTVVVWPTPSSCKDLDHFLVFANFYCSSSLVFQVCVGLAKLPSVLEMVDLVIQHVFWLHRIPCDIVSDCGPQFVPQAIKGCLLSPWSI
ncbi:hypothetical protein L3Q82_021916, partial [Scortum barcoo]